MSLQQTAYVVRAKVPDRTALQAAVDVLGFDCKIDAFYVPFQCSGFLPCVLAGRKSGCEVYFESTAEALSDFPDLAESVGNRDVAITFRWGGDMSECACVLIVSAALAISFGAIVHYQDDDMLYSGEQLAEEARSALQAI
ncbi:MAG: hypothetical protein HY040_07720 [Planctomycetes bacterium]|nr:hypothetical protein [Planctomycetota bacterium]